MNKQEQPYWQIVKPYIKGIDIYHDPKTYLDSIAIVPKPMTLIYAADFCLSEIHNGGLLQFFSNSTGIVAPEALEGFDSLGMSLLATIVRQACDLLGSPYPRDRKDRWDALLVASGRGAGELTKIFEENDDRYIAFAKATELLPFDEWDRQIWNLAKSENGGFGDAAFRFLANL